MSHLYNYKPVLDTTGNIRLHAGRPSQMTPPCDEVLCKGSLFLDRRLSGSITPQTSFKQNLTDKRLQNQRGETSQWSLERTQRANQYLTQGSKGNRIFEQNSCFSYLWELQIMLKYDASSR